MGDGVGHFLLLFLLTTPLYVTPVDNATRVANIVYDIDEALPFRGVAGLRPGAALNRHKQHNRNNAGLLTSQ